MQFNYINNESERLYSYKHSSPGSGLKTSLVRPIGLIATRPDPKTGAATKP